jgi:hypothetical protein
VRLWLTEKRLKKLTGWNLQVYCEAGKERLFGGVKSFRMMKTGRIYMITIVAMSKERYELAAMMPETASLEVLNPKEPKVNEFVVAFETESRDDAVAKIPGIVEAHIHRGPHKYLMLFETRMYLGAEIGNSYTIDLDKIPNIETR